MLSGRQIGGYQIQEELGRGAMGVVFKAKQLSMDRIVAIKFLPKRLARDERIVARFLREARAAGQLAHPNIVSVHELGLADGLHFIAMEYVDGNSVQKQIKDRGCYSEREALDIAAQIAEALKVAHSRGILHRDIKPDNFLIDTSHRVRLADLGLASLERTDQTDGGLTQDGTTLGTPHYMSPEQCSGTGTDNRSDLYSLGASMFVMVSGRTPYEGSTAAAVMVKVLTEPPQSLKKLRPEVSNGYVAIVEKLMQKEPSKRFQTAAEVAEAIQQCKQGHYKVAVAPKPLPTPRLAGKAGPAQKNSTGKDNSGHHTPYRSAKPTGTRLMAGALIATIAALATLFSFLIKTNPRPLAERPHEPQPAAPSEAVIRHTAIDTTTVVHAPPRKLDTTKTEETVAASGTGWQELIVLQKQIRNEKITPVVAHNRFERWMRLHANELPGNFALGLAKRETENLVNTYGEKVASPSGPETKWDKIAKVLDAAATNDERNAALTSATQFAEAEAEKSPDKAKALARIESLVKETLDSAENAAERNNYPEALETVRALTAQLPKPQAETLKAKLAFYDQALKANQEFADFYGRVVDKACFIDAITKKRFPLADAAKFAAEEGPRLKFESNRADAAELAKLVDDADKILAMQREQINSGAKAVEVRKKIGNFENCKITHWDEKGILFISSKLSMKEPQPFPFESVSAPEVVLNIATDFYRKPNGSLTNQWEIATVALVLGNRDEAAKRIKEAIAASDSGSAARPIVALNKRLGKPEPAVSAEDIAKQVYAEFTAASQAGDATTQKTLRQKLIADYAETEIVKKNLELISADPKPAVPAVAAKPDVKPETKPAVTAAAAAADPDKKKPEVSNPAEKEGLDQLQKAGFADVSGTWLYDKATGQLRVDGNAELVLPVLDGDIEVGFRFLGPNAKIRILSRCDKTIVGDPFHLFCDATTAPGFGIDMRPNQYSIYFDYKTKAGAVKEPTNYHTQSIDPATPFHRIYFSHHGTELSISVDAKTHVNGKNGGARSTGDMRVIVSGPIQIYVPKYTPAK